MRTAIGNLSNTDFQVAVFFVSLALQSGEFAGLLGKQIKGENPSETLRSKSMQFSIKTLTIRA